MRRWAGTASRQRLSALLVVGFVGVLALFVFSQRSVSQPSSLDLSLEPCTPGPYCISWILPAGHGWELGLRQGDRVLSVLDPAGTTHSPYRAVSVERDGATFNAISPDERAVATARWVLPLVGLVFASVGTLVLWRRSDLEAAWSFWFLSLAVGATGVLFPAVGFSGPVWSVPLQFALILVIPWSLSRFLANIVSVASRPYRLAEPFIIAIGLCLGIVYALILTLSPNSYDLIRAPASLYFILLTVAGLGFLGYGFARSPSGEERAAVRDVALATFLGFAPLLLLVFIPIFMRGEELIRPELAALALVIIPLGFVYSVFRHQILGIRRLVNRGLVHGALSVLIFGTVIVLVYAIDQIFPKAISLERYEIWMVAILVIVSVLIFTGVRPPLQHLIDRRLYRDSYDYASALAGFTKQVKGQVTAYDVVTSMLANLTGLMKVEGFLLMRNSGDEREHRYSGGQAAARLLQASGRPDFVPGPGLAIKYMEGEPVLAVPLEDDWTLWLGPKAGGEAFRNEDLRLVDAVASLVSVLLTRIRQNEELRDLNGRIVTAQEEERTRLSHEIHDGPLQQISVITRLPGQTEQAVQIARDAARELRAISAALHPPVLDLFGLIPGLEWLAEEAMAQHKLQITVTHAGFDEEARLPDPVELALFRCVQESLTNITKHAQATAVSITLELRPGEVLVRVEDDGVGFDMKRRAEAAAGGHLGLVGMRERLVHLSGELQINSSVGRGTTIRLRIPLELPAPTPVEAV